MLRRGLVTDLGIALGMSYHPPLQLAFLLDIALS